MKIKFLSFFTICLFQFNFLHAQKWLWGAEGNTGSDNYGAAVDNNGDAYLAGAFYSSISFGNQSLISQTEDAFLVKYDPNGNVIWAEQSKSLTPTSLCFGIGACMIKALIIICVRFLHIFVTLIKGNPVLEILDFHRTNRFNVFKFIAMKEKHRFTIEILIQIIGILD